MQILSNFVAKEVNVLKLHVPRAGGKGWNRANSEIDAQDSDFVNNWCEEVSSGAKYVLEETWAKANDPHYDAKVWPIAHPYGTGSELSEVGSGSPQAHARNRATSIQSFFQADCEVGFLETGLLHQEAALQLELLSPQTWSTWAIRGRARPDEAALRNHRADFHP